MFSVANIDCATCALAIERRLKKIDGVKEVGSAIMLNKIFVDYDGSRTDVPQIIQAIKETRYFKHIIYNSDPPR